MNRHLAKNLLQKSEKITRGQPCARRGVASAVLVDNFFQGRVYLNSRNLINSIDSANTFMIHVTSSGSLASIHCSATEPGIKGKLRVSMSRG
jgi:UDP-N-acetylenolpyruvoylglucosamine reductase